MNQGELYAVRAHTLRTSEFRCVTFSPDGRRVAGGAGDGCIWIWDIESGAVLRVLEGHENWVWSVAWAGDGRLASGSDDNTVRVWDASSGRALQVLKGHENGVRSVAWAGDGRLASGSEDKTVRVWDASSGRALQVLKGHENWVRSVAWAGDGRLASGSYDKTVRVWDASSGRALQVLKGHENGVWSVAWAGDGRLLISQSADGQVLVWDVEAGEVRARFDAPGYRWAGQGVRFSATPAADIETEDGTIRVSSSPVEAGTQANLRTSRYRSAKVVLMGESGTGKSSLAHVLAKGEYAKIESTVGMQIWTLEPKQLHAAAPEPPAGERREIFLWDLGGQEEYRLIHQLFLHDTRIALLLFDPTRGEDQFERAEEWAVRLQQQVSRRGGRVEKLLIRSKKDESPDALIDGPRVRALQTKHGFAEYLEVSALEPKWGIDDLRRILTALINWDQLAQEISFGVYQDCYEIVNAQRMAGKTILAFGDLERQLEKTGGFAARDLDRAIRSLAEQGIVAELDTFGGERVLILRVDDIERYAGSIIRTARGNLRGLPAIEEAALFQTAAAFPGVPAENQLPVETRQIVVQCVVQLLVEKGVCLRSQGLLIFPSEFSLAREQTANLPHRQSVHFDFSGAVNSLYAPLVCQLHLSGQFGAIRMWKGWAQFEHSAGGVYALSMTAEHHRGRFEIHFNDAADGYLRRLFADFVQAHLKRENITARLGRDFRCEGGHYFDDATVEKVLERGETEVRCPICAHPHSLLAWEPRDRDDRMEREPGRRRTTSARAFKQKPAAQPWRILHLSDLHLKESDDVDEALQPLRIDLEKQKIGAVDYLVVSGDLADRGKAKGFERAREFLSRLIDDLHLTPERLIVAPGNHDVDYNSPGQHEFLTERQCRDRGLNPSGLPKVGNVHRVETERYKERFESFRSVYHKLTGVDYPLAPEAQYRDWLFEGERIQFLALNSAYQIDEHEPVRIGLEKSARSKGLREADERIRFARTENKLAADAEVLRIAVWHHAVDGDRKIPDADLAYLELLSDSGFALCLHGDVHQVRDGVMNPFRKQIYVAGAGSFHAGANDRPESTPRLYNLIEVNRDLSRIRVNVRAQDTAGGAFDQYAKWDKGGSKVGYYEIRNPPRRQP